MSWYTYCYKFNIILNIIERDWVATFVPPRQATSRVAARLPVWNRGRCGWRWRGCRSRNGWGNGDPWEHGPKSATTNFPLAEIVRCVQCIAKSNCRDTRWAELWDSSNTGLWGLAKSDASLRKKTGEKRGQTILIHIVDFQPVAVRSNDSCFIAPFLVHFLNAIILHCRTLCCRGLQLVVAATSESLKIGNLCLKLVPVLVILDMFADQFAEPFLLRVTARLILLQNWFDELDWCPRGWALEPLRAPCFKVLIEPHSLFNEHCFVHFVWS